MLHHHLSSYDELTGAHYGVSRNKKSILVQLQDERGEQVRVKMTPEEAERMGMDLICNANQVRLNQQVTIQ